MKFGSFFSLFPYNSLLKIQLNIILLSSQYSSTVELGYNMIEGAK